MRVLGPNRKKKKSILKISKAEFGPKFEPELKYYCILLSPEIFMVLHAFFIGNTFSVQPQCCLTF